MQDPIGQAALLRMNWLQPPFNNPAIRRLVLHAVVQSDYLTAMLGDDTALWHEPMGAFTPGTPLARKEPVDQRGWSLFFTFSAGADMATPAGQLMMRGIGEKAWFGWPADPELERLRDAWFAAPSLTDQQQVARELQSRVFETVPFVPLGQYFQPTAYRKTVHRMLDGFATFWYTTLDA